MKFNQFVEAVAYQRFIPDPLKAGNVFVFHGTRFPTSIWQKGIIPSVAGVINKDPTGAAVFAAETPEMASSKVDYEEKLRTQVRGTPVAKGNRFIVIASVPENEIQITITNSDLRIRRAVTPDELVAIYPDKREYSPSGKFKNNPFFVKPEYKEFAQSINNNWSKKRNEF